MDLEEARRAILSLSLPDELEELGAGADETSAPLVAGDSQGAVVASNLVAFPKDMPVEVRNAVSDWCLLAQLAATKAVPDKEATEAWMDTYLDTLTGTGWVWAEGVRSYNEESAFGSTVHEKILQVVSVTLAPAFPAAAALVVLTLQALSDVEKDSPWIRLFDRRASSAHNAGFSVGSCDFDVAGVVSLRGVDFLVEASETMTQVLFFKFTSQSATVRRRTRVLTLSKSLLDQLGATVHERVQSQLAANLLALKI